MAVRSIVTLEAAKVRATLLQAALAASNAKLYQRSLVPGQTTTKAELTAAVATFDGYAPKAIAAWSAPVLAVLSGWSINGGLLSWSLAADAATPNTIGGMWFETAAADVAGIIDFGDPGVPMALAGQSVDLVPTDISLTSG